MAKIAVSKNTHRLLQTRTDDYRVSLIDDVMFSDDISGSHPERKFTVADESGKESTYTLRKADIYDTLEYFKVGALSDIKTSIESNIVNIQRIKKNGTVAGMLPIKDVWVFIFTVDKETGGDLSMNVYFNPDSTDCSEIFKSERSIVLVGFVMTHPVKGNVKAADVPEGFPEEVYEFNFISPLDSTNLREYEDIAIEEEAKQLRNMFLIKFKPGEVMR